MMSLAIVGDVHGQAEGLAALDRAIATHDLTIQVGDLGFFPHVIDWIEQQDPERFKFFIGNHDKYELVKHLPHNMGRFGEMRHGDLRIFHVCGAKSHDKEAQQALGDWQPDEELSWAEANECLDLWDACGQGVDIVLSHDCPLTASYRLISFEENTHTRNLLETMFRTFPPKRWFFGHHHRSLIQNIFGTEFRCVAINEIVTVA